MSHLVTNRATPTNGGGKKPPIPRPWDDNPGWFMAPVVAWKSMRFESRLAGPGVRHQNTSYACMLAREKRMAAGSEAAKGTMVMENTPDTPMPKWMNRATPLG